LAGPGAGDARVRGGRDDRRRRPLDHTRPDRLPHAPWLRRQPGARVRAAAGRRQLRGDRAGGRWHHLHRQGDASGVAGGAGGGIAFDAAQTARVFETAKRLGLPVKLHADQLSNLGGAALAARFGALSADHLEYTDEAGAAAMARAGTVAVLLPGAFYFIRETRKPPVELFRAHGVNMALATDCNPGSSPLTSLLLAMN